MSGLVCAGCLPDLEPQRGHQLENPSRLSRHATLQQEEKDQTSVVRCRLASAGHRPTQERFPCRVISCYILHKRLRVTVVCGKRDLINRDCYQILIVVFGDIGMFQCGECVEANQRLSTEFCAFARCDAHAAHSIALSQVRLPRSYR